MCRRWEIGSWLLLADKKKIKVSWYKRVYREIRVKKPKKNHPQFVL